MARVETAQRRKRLADHAVRAGRAVVSIGRIAGPLDAKSVALVKLALALGSELEGGTHSAVRKALDAGCTREELLHVSLLATTTMGFPAMMRGRSWVLDVVDGKPDRTASSLSSPGIGRTRGGVQDVEVSAATLERVAASAIQADQPVRVLDHEFQPFGLSTADMTTGGLWRLRGTAADSRGYRTFHAVLKWSALPSGGPASMLFLRRRGPTSLPRCPGAPRRRSTRAR